MEDEEPKCAECEKRIDFSKELEGRDFDNDEDGEFRHLKCELKRGFNAHCPNDGWFVDGMEEEDADGNIVYVCPECKGELEEAKPTLKDFQFKPNFCICGHSDAVHSKWVWNKDRKAHDLLCWIDGDTWKMKEGN